MGLKQELESLRPRLAQAAQHVVDEWQQDEDGFDEEFGGGGACDEVARAMMEIVSELDDVSMTEGGHDGDDHSWIIVYNDAEAFALDIPPGVYETGGGYSWKKIEGAEIGPEDVVVMKIDRDLVTDW